MEIKKSQSLQDYSQALLYMDKRVDGVIKGGCQELIWFLEHFSVISAGSSASKGDLLNNEALPIYQTGRGGKYTYHGPGQRVIYFIFDLKKRYATNYPDIKQYVYDLEQLIIQSLKEVKIEGKRISDKVGIWINTDEGIKKIAAIGIRVRKWVSFHGIAININPDLSNFDYFVPCGIKEYGVTSLQKLGVDCNMDKFDSIVEKNIKEIFKL